MSFRCGLMFLTIGDKIREAREKYGVKQIAFESYGFSRYYISMIETKRRSLNENMFRTMYDALCELSDYKYLQEYSYDEFVKSPTEQAKDWLERNCNIEVALHHYQQYSQIALEYGQIHYQIKLEKMLGDYYIKKGRLLLANNHLLKAIGYCIQHSINPAYLYERVGKNYILMGQYQEAISAFNLSMNCLDEVNKEHLTRIMYCIAFAYLNDGKDDESLEWINPILSQNEFPKLRAAGYLIKETILKRKGQAEEGRQVLLEFINNPCYEQYLGFAYHNLGCSFKDSALYYEALEALQTALFFRESPQEYAMTKCLMGEIYFKIGNYEKAQELLLQVKDIVFSQCLIEQKEATIAWGFELYWTTRNFESVLKLLEDVVRLVENEILPLSIYTNLQNRIYKSIIEDVLKRKEDLTQYRNILDVIN